MPYIKPDERKAFDEAIARLGNITTPGELNYVITRLCHQYLLNKGTNYDNLNAITGVLECSKLEITRRLTAPYEDNKIKINGDVF